MDQGKELVSIKMDSLENPVKERAVTSAGGKFRASARQAFLTAVAKRFLVSYEFMDNLDSKYIKE